MRTWNETCPFLRNSLFFLNFQTNIILIITHRINYTALIIVYIHPVQWARQMRNKMNYFSMAKGHNTCTLNPFWNPIENKFWMKMIISPHWLLIKPFMRYFITTNKNHYNLEKYRFSWQYETSNTCLLVSNVIAYLIDCQSIVTVRGELGRAVKDFPRHAGSGHCNKIYSHSDLW